MWEGWGCLCVECWGCQGSAQDPTCRCRAVGALQLCLVLLFCWFFFKLKGGISFPDGEHWGVFPGTSRCRFFQHISALSEVCL